MTTQTESTRPSAAEINDRVLKNGTDELGRPPQALAISGLFAGFTLGATPLVVAFVAVLLGGGDSATFVASLFYPIGFIAVILGRSQLFTENTLYPVVASFDNPRRVTDTAKLWATVLVANSIGAFVFALAAVKTGALPNDVISQMVQLGDEAVFGSFWRNFWSAVLGGWLLATVAWLVEATATAVGQVLVIWALVFVVGVAALDHTVSTAIQVEAALLEGELGVGNWLGWLGTTVLGNALGGVIIVSLFNYGQVRTPRRKPRSEQDSASEAAPVGQ